MEQKSLFFQIRLMEKESKVKADICIIIRVSRTIGALRGRAARGAPKRY
jgi:hypothetical protein